MGTFESLKAVWKKLGICGQVKNFSSIELWVIQTSPRVIALRLPPRYKTPIVSDIDAFKRVDGLAIEGHKNWWKIYDISTAEIYDSPKSLLVSAISKTAVKEGHFGEPNIRTRRDPQLLNNISLKG